MLQISRIWLHDVKCKLCEMYQSPEKFKNVYIDEKIRCVHIDKFIVITRKKGKKEYS